MTFRVTGLGWAGAQGYGRARDPASPRWRPGAPESVSLRAIFDQPEGRAGRLDPFSRLGLAAAAMALIDAGRPPAQGAKRPVALVAQSEGGCLPTDADFYRTVLPQAGRLASPQLFAYTLPTCFLGEAAIRFRLTGPTVVLSGGGPLAALEAGLDLVADGEAEAALCGFADLPPVPELALPGDAPTGAVFLMVEPGDAPGALAPLERRPGGAALAGQPPPADFPSLLVQLLAFVEKHR